MSRQKVASFPGHSQILSHGCEIKSGSGLGTRFGIVLEIGALIMSDLNVLLHPLSGEAQVPHAGPRVAETACP